MNWQLRAIAFTATILVAAGAARAELLSYTNGAGMTFYVDSVDKVPSQFRGRVRNLKDGLRISRAGSARYSAVRPPQSPSEIPFEGRRAPAVNIYVTDYCPYCEQLESYLKARKVRYKRYDINQDQKALKVFQDLGGTGVPLTTIGKRKVDGFNEAVFDRELSFSKRRE